MQKILINTQVGGFDITKKAFDRLIELGCKDAIEEMEIITGILEEGFPMDIIRFGIMLKRDDPLLIQVYEEFGDSINNKDTLIKLIEIPDGVKWYIYENDDGRESIHEKHRTWE